MANVVVLWTSGAWQALAHQQYTEHQVNGDHFSMLSNKQHQALSLLLDRYWG